MTRGGLGTEGDKYHIVNFAEATGESTIVNTTTSLAIFVAPVPCTIKDISMGVTTAISAASTNTWTMQIVNQTGDANLLSTAFDTDSDNAVADNGGRAFSADTPLSLNDNAAGVNFLQNAVLAKGDILLLTATKGASATDMANPMVVVTYRT